MICVFALSAPCGARAQDPAPAKKPVPKVGAILEYADKFATVRCQRWQVKDLDKGGFLIAQCKDNFAYLSVANDYNLTKIVTEDGEILAEFKPYLPSIAFPLQLGKRWGGRYSGYTADDGNRWLANASCEVTAYETVKLVAGEFAAYRIECVDNWELGNMSGHSYSTSWYSPKVQAVVKVSNERFPKWNMELVGYSTK